MLGGYSPFIPPSSNNKKRKSEDITAPAQRNEHIKAKKPKPNQPTGSVADHLKQPHVLQTNVPMSANENGNTSSLKGTHLAQVKSEENEEVELVDTMGSYRPSLAMYNAASRPPFFELYERVMKKLSSADHNGKVEAKDFYGHLKEWFEFKTEDENFDVSSFDPTPIEERVVYFNKTARRLAAARAEGLDTRMILFELRSILQDCKQHYPVEKRLVKLEDDQH